MNVPKGWKLVPVEPTTEMMEAAFNATRDDQIDWMRQHYRAMPAAAPPPPVQQDDKALEVLSMLVDTAEEANEYVGRASWSPSMHEDLTRAIERARAFIAKRGEK